MYANRILRCHVSTPKKNSLRGFFGRLRRRRLSATDDFVVETDNFHSVRATLVSAPLRALGDWFVLKCAISKGRGGFRTLSGVASPSFGASWFYLFVSLSAINHIRWERERGIVYLESSLYSRRASYPQATTHRHTLDSIRHVSLPR